MEMVYYPYPKAPFLLPEQVVAELDLAAGEKVLDFGAGAGFWAIPMAQAIGASGHIYVTDPKPENLSIIKSKAQRAGLDNLSYFHASYNCGLMPIQTKVDLILCSNVLSMVKEPEKLLANLKKLAKEGTKLAIIDWNEKAVMGTGLKRRIEVETLILKLNKLGFEFRKLLSAGAQHTGLFFVYQK